MKYSFCNKLSNFYTLISHEISSLISEDKYSRSFIHCARVRYDKDAWKGISRYGLENTGSLKRKVRFDP